jgi:hypothetical protein
MLYLFMKTKRNIFQTVLLVAVMLAFRFAINASAADGTPVWTNYFNGAANADDIAKVVVLDGSGNAYVTGQSYGMGNYYHWITIKYASTGLPVWTNLFDRGGTFHDRPYAMALDTNSNVYVTGSSYGGASVLDFTTIKYSSAGVPVWTNFYDRTGNSSDEASALAVDTNGNVCVTGSSSANGQTVWATIKYSSGGVTLWTNLFITAGAFSANYPEALAVDGVGNVYVTGEASTSTPVCATIKYSGAGVALWTNFFSRTGFSSCQPTALALDASANVYVTGFTSAGSVGSQDWGTVKYSSAGVPLWTNLFNGDGNGSDAAKAIAVDSSGNVYVTGYATGSASGQDYAIIKYSGGGVPLWTNLFNGAFNDTDSANAIALDGNGNVYVTGVSYGASGWLGYATLKYSGAGTPIWTNSFNSAVNANVNSLCSLAVDASGNVHMAGSSLGSGGSEDYTAIKYSGPPPPGYNQVTSQTLPGGKVRLGFVGNPGANYALDRSLSLTQTNWSPQITNTADGSGALTFTNTPNAATANFWRVRSVP